MSADEHCYVIAKTTGFFEAYAAFIEERRKKFTAVEWEWDRREEVIVAQANAMLGLANAGDTEQNMIRQQAGDLFKQLLLNQV